MKKYNVGIVGYGAYVPRYRLPASEVSRIWTDGAEGLPIKEKSVPGLDEDVATMSIEAARNALMRAEIDPQELGAIWVGSEMTKGWIAIIQNLLKALHSLLNSRDKFFV